MVYTLGNVVIKKTGCFQGMLRLCKIIEEHRYSRQHLDAYFRHIHFFHARVRVPAVLLYFAKHLVAFDHPGTARLMMLQSYKLTIPKLLEPVWDVFRHDMRMDIYFQNGDLKV